ncbi:MAG: hypothetical protein EOO11_20520 [Chitinophagaceae bacterium]|nr:MAG: hypothetical protein EOO11_20520 [Chitinophagaceae bacterium]
MDTDDALHAFVDAVRGKPWRFRLGWSEGPAGGWDRWLIVPTPSYVETGTSGPLPVRQLQWIDVDPVEQRWVGRVAGSGSFDHSAELHALLARLHLRYRLVDGFFRIQLS